MGFVPVYLWCDEYDTCIGMEFRICLFCVDYLIVFIGVMRVYNWFLLVDHNEGRALWNDMCLVCRFRSIWRDVLYWMYITWIDCGIERKRVPDYFCVKDPFRGIRDFPFPSDIW